MNMYENLNLTFSQDEDGKYYISAQDLISNDKVSRRFELPFSWIEIDNFLKEFESLRVDRNKLECFGRKLFSSVFSGTILDFYSSKLHVKKHIDGISLNLIFEDGAKDLTRIPWELMFDGKNFISCSMRTPVIRYIRSIEPPSSSEIMLPIRILFVVSNPLGSKPLNLGGQIRRICKSLNKYTEEGNIEIHCLTGREFDRSYLIQSIKEGMYHILHISGHGEFYERSGNIFLELEDGRGERSKLNVVTLASWLQDSTIKFVYLDACQTAITPEKSLKFTVWHLFDSGIRGILGMQLSISNDTAIKFSDAFYSEIIKGKPVQAAISYARTAVVNERCEYEVVEWAIPVLYASTPDILKISGNGKLKKRYRVLDTNEIFIGRENYLDEITEALIDTNTRIVLIYGFGGIGKSALARQLINNLRGYYDDICWIDLRRIKGFDSIVSEINSMLIFHGIGIHEDEFQKLNPQERSNKIAENLDKKKFLTVFDNFEIVEEDVLVRNIIKEIDKKENTSVLITTRMKKIMGRRQRSVRLDKLPEEESIHFIRTLARNHGIRNIENDNETLKQINLKLDGHPKAIEIVIPYLNSLSAKIALRELPKVIGNDITPILDWTYNKLNETQKNILRKISIFVGEVGFEELIAINKDIDILKELKAFESCAFLNFDKTKDKYYLHALVQDFAYTKLEDKGKIHLQAYKYYRYMCLPEKCVKKEDVHSLIEAHYHACKAKEYDKAADIIFNYNLDKLLDRWGNYRTLVDLYQKILPKDPFRDDPLLSNLRIHSSVLGNLGHAYRALSEVKKAIKYYEKALRIAQEVGDRKNEGEWLGGLGKAHYILSDVRKAIEYYEKALEISQEVGDRKNEGEWFGNLGHAYNALSDARKAIEYYEKALEISQEIEDRQGEGTWFGSFGIAYFALDDARKAIEYYEKALEITQEIGSKKNVGIWLRNIGIAYRNLGEVRKAIEYYKKAQKIAQEIGDRNSEGALFGNLGNAYYDSGETRKAIEYHEKALEIAQEIEDRNGEGTSLGNLGNAYCALGETRKAIKYSEKALKIAQEIEDRLGEGEWLNNLGDSFRKEKKYKDALACYLIAKDRFSQIKGHFFETIKSSLKNLEEELGEKEFEKLAAEVVPRADEIVRKVLERVSD